MFKLPKLPKLKDLKKMSPISLKEVLDTAIERGVIIYAEDVIKLRNKMLGYKGSELRKKNREDYLKVKQEWYSSDRYKARYEEIQNNRLRKKLERIQKKTGITPKAGQLTVFGIPTTNILDMTMEDYINSKVLENSLGPEGERLAESTVRYKSKKDYLKARELARSAKLNDIDKYSLNYTHDFLDNYFQSYTKPDLIARVKEYTKYLSVQQRYDLMETLSSFKFKQVYDSDSDSDTYFEDAGQRADNRLRDIIKVLRNETGLNVRANKSGTVTSVTESKAKLRKGGKWSFANFVE